MRNRCLLGAGVALAASLVCAQAQAQFLTGPGTFYFGGEGGWTSLPNQTTSFQGGPGAPAFSRRERLGDRPPARAVERERRKQAHVLRAHERHAAHPLAREVHQLRRIAEVHFDEPQQRASERRLPTPRLADDAHRTPRGDLKTHTVDRPDQLAAALDEIERMDRNVGKILIDWGSTGPGTSMYCETSRSSKANFGFARRWAMLASDPVTRLSRHNTSQPFPSMYSHRCEPKNPAPPVITARTLSSPIPRTLFLFPWFIMAETAHYRKSSCLDGSIRNSVHPM